MARAALRSAACAVLLSTACSGDPPAATAPLGVPAMPPGLVLPPVDTSLPPQEGSVNLAGSVSSLVGGFQLQDSVGTIEIAGRPLPAIVVAESSFVAQAIFHHQIYALSDDGFFVVWAYCSAGVIKDVYVLDSRDGTGRFDAAKGTCDEIQRTSATPVRLPGAELPWPRVHTGFEVTGKSLQLHAEAPGAVLYDGAVQAAIPFAVIDCTRCDGSGGWYELHSLLWEPGLGGITLGIFYLDSRDHSHVSFEYVIDLGSLEQVRGETYAAEWRFAGPVPFAVGPPRF